MIMDQVPSTGEHHEELVVGLNVDRQNVDRQNVEQTKCRTDKMSKDKMPNRQNVDKFLFLFFQFFFS